jgi:hypothetical protein
VGGRKPQGFITVKDRKTGENQPVPVFKPSKKPGKVRRRLDMREYASSVEVQEIVRFLARTLSDNPRTAVRFHERPDLFAASEEQGRPVIGVPTWGSYHLPLEGYDQWRIYRMGVWHETKHIEDTPELLYTYQPHVEGLHPDTARMLLNIIEDKRIEDRGLRYDLGLTHEKVYDNTYIYAIRPDLEGLGSPERMILEAFGQKLHLGKMKGTLPPHLEDRVNETVEYVLEKLGEMERLPPKDPVIYTAMTGLIPEVVERLQLLKPPPQDPSQDDGRGGEQDSQRDQEPKGPASPDDDDFDPALEDLVDDDGLSDAQVDPDQDLKIDLPPWDRNRGAPPEMRVHNDDLQMETRERVAEDMEEYLEWLRDETAKPEDETSGGALPQLSEDDLERVVTGSEQSQQEYRSIQAGGSVPKELSGEFLPIAAYGDSSKFRDTRFKRDMKERLKDWQTGKTLERRRHGARLDVRGYVDTKGRKPFRKVKAKTVKGQKYLFVLDFSGSMQDQRDEYKRALINTMDVLESIGAKTAVFGFGAVELGSYRTYGNFRVKTFEEGRWKQTHNQKIAALDAGGTTPTASVYHGLNRYIGKHRPEYVITITDGEPDERDEVQRHVRRLNRQTRMVAFGISPEGEEDAMKESLDEYPYRETFTVPKDNLRRLPDKIVDLIAPE